MICIARASAGGLGRRSPLLPALNVMVLRVNPRLRETLLVTPDEFIASFGHYVDARAMSGFARWEDQGAIYRVWS
jgi:hypothetical protein